MFSKRIRDLCAHYIQTHSYVWIIIDIRLKMTCFACKLTKRKMSRLRKGWTFLNSFTSLQEFKVHVRPRGILSGTQRQNHDCRYSTLRGKSCRLEHISYQNYTLATEEIFCTGFTLLRYLRLTTLVNLFQPCL